MRAHWISIVSVMITARLVAAPNLSSNQILNAIASQGAKPVLEDLWSAPDRMRTVLMQIESGDPNWLKVATKLYPVSDAGASTSLLLSVSRALIPNSDAVLSLIDAPFPFKDVCTIPYFEVDRKTAWAFVEAAKRSLSKVQNKNLAMGRRCSKRIEGVYELTEWDLSKLEKRLASEGVVPVWLELTEHDERFEVLLERLLNADDQALRITAKLRGSANISNGERLDRAVMGGLWRSPDQVLKVIKESLNWQSICSPKFARESERKVLVKQAVKALQGVIAPELKPLAKQCAKQLQL